ncbi:MAG: threonine synthase [Methanomassiliicoccaceae archaeon]|jgi:threonine synthase|nr:threonine synthase [Methanomassiliicoccaceae archaeon]
MREEGAEGCKMAPHKIVCWDCGRAVDDQYADTCPACGGLLTIKMDLEPLMSKRPEDLHKVPLGVWRYKDFMPADPARKVSVQEGGTPLYPCGALGGEIKIKDLWVKYEGANPTGSFKDRGMTIGVTHAVEIGAKVVGCASTGNTSASLAAYAAKAGMKCAVFLPSGKVAAGKLAQAMFFGAKVISIDGNFDDALRAVRELARGRHLYLLNSINPYRPEGQKSVLLEIMDQLAYDVPDRIVLPVGNAGNISAVHKAITELEEIGWISKIPMLTGIQAEGSMPIVRAFGSNEKDFIPEENPETVATAIRIGNPVSGRKALKAIYDTGGYSTSVTDEEILAAQKLLGRREGIGVEPASAASVAGAKKLRDMGIIDKDEKVVCICTGNALKDPDTIISSSDPPIRSSKDILSIIKILSM